MSDEQMLSWAEHVRRSNAEGKCEHSGYLFMDCVRSVCDCGWEDCDEEMVEAEAAELIAAAREVQP